MMSSPLVIDRAMLMALAGEARRLNNPPWQMPPGAMAGERASKQQGRGLNFDSLRRYQPGDDIRLIDWQATARLRSPWIRLYNEERERPIFLLVDQRLDMYFATRGQSKSVVAATLAGLLAWRSWHDSDRLGCLVFNDETCTLTPCRSPKISLTPLLNDLERYNQRLAEQYPQEVTATMTLTRSLQRLEGSVPTGSWLAIISDFHDLDAHSEALLAGLRRRCEISAFVTLDDLHLRLPAQGQLAAWYQDRQTILSLSPDLRSRIQDSVTTRLANQKNRLTRLGIKVNQIGVGEDLLPQLQKGF
jgi:uncharacterized protein (DUF58 family)